MQRKGIARHRKDASPTNLNPLSPGALATFSTEDAGHHHQVWFVPSCRSCSACYAAMLLCGAGGTYIGRLGKYLTEVPTYDFW